FCRNRPDDSGFGIEEQPPDELKPYERLNGGSKRRRRSRKRVRNDAKEQNAPPAYPIGTASHDQRGYRADVEERKPEGRRTLREMERVAYLLQRQGDDAPVVAVEECRRAEQRKQDAVTPVEPRPSVRRARHVFASAARASATAA